MARFATKTKVSPEKTKMEIEALVKRYGATGFASAWQDERAMLSFVIANRQIRFTMSLPKFGSEQIVRTKWRSLKLLVKAKLEAVDAKIATIEESFFADIVMSDGRTVYERAREAVALEYKTGATQTLLPAN